MYQQNLYLRNKIRGVHGLETKPMYQQHLYLRNKNSRYV